ncbi:MAG: serine O-acetyltransferase EpsC [Oligoflexus sp.]
MSKKSDHSLSLGHQPPAYQTLCALREGIDTLVRRVTEGLLFEKNPEIFFTDKVEPVLEELLEYIRVIYSDTHVNKTAAHVKDMLGELHSIETLLRSDIEAALANDPATQDPLEVIFCYPGFKAIRYHRIAHLFYQRKIPLLPRMIAEQAHETTGIDIHPGANIDSHFFIDHGTGVVIGETAIIGRGVTIYQGVTLGAKRFYRNNDGTVVKGQPRHPIIEDRVTIYSGATVLGRITIGKDSIIGGNVWLTESVPASSRITQQRYHSKYFIDGDGI